MARIAFIGLGAMGAPMAASLAAAGEAVMGFDRLDGAGAAAAALGVPVAAAAEEAATQAEVVVTMLQTGEQVLDVWRTLLPVAAKGALFVDCSTIDLESARSAHLIARASQAMAIDAPVSGGVVGARGRSLTFMCGAEADAYARAKPLLETMGARIFHCGGPGLGQAAKLCNNLMLGVTMIATAEAFGLASRIGLQPEALFEVAAVSSGQSWSLTSYCPVPGPVPSAPANRDYRPGFATRLMLKDLRLAEAAAGKAGAVTPLCAAAAQLYALYEAQGGGANDFSGVYEMIAGAHGERGAGPRPRRSVPA
ncbi:3-hydroxyisobutyrate dehydrogenase [Methylocystis echinoides]|uniref:3-hydroxyisobutyrate dehydrogenase n=1 Tax=Methylocystis echinoides TaxID=29468 RepID=UPI00342B1105